MRVGSLTSSAPTGAGTAGVAPGDVPVPSLSRQGTSFDTTTSVPLDLMAAGTSFCTAGSAATAGVVVVGVAAEFDELLEPQAAITPPLTTTTATISNALNDLIAPSLCERTEAAYARRRTTCRTFNRAPTWPLVP